MHSLHSSAVHGGSHHTGRRKSLAFLYAPKRSAGPGSSPIGGHGGGVGASPSAVRLLRYGGLVVGRRTYLAVPGKTIDDMIAEVLVRPIHSLFYFWWFGYWQLPFDIKMLLSFHPNS